MSLDFRQVREDETDDYQALILSAYAATKVPGIYFDAASTTRENPAPHTTSRGIRPLRRSDTGFIGHSSLSLGSSAWPVRPATPWLVCCTPRLSGQALRSSGHGTGRTGNTDRAVTCSGRLTGYGNQPSLAEKYVSETGIYPYAYRRSGKRPYHPVYEKNSQWIRAHTLAGKTDVTAEHR